MSSPLSYLNFTSCFKFERTAAFCLAECATLFCPKAQKTLLFRFSPRPHIYYCLWVLGGWNEKKKKTPQKESISSNFYTLPTAWPWMAGGKTFEAPQIEKEEEKKSSRQPLSSFPRCCVPELIEGLIAKVHFTNGCFSHRDQFFVPLLNPPFSCVYGPVHGRQICLQFAGDEVRNLFKIRLTPVCLIMQRFLAFELQFSRFKC